MMFMYVHMHGVTICSNIIQNMILGPSLFGCL